MLCVSVEANPGDGLVIARVEGRRRVLQVPPPSSCRREDRPCVPATRLGLGSNRNTVLDPFIARKVTRKDPHTGRPAVAGGEARPRVSDTSHVLVDGPAAR